MNNEEILYQIVAVDSELKKGFPDEITTILKNGITGKTYTDYDFKNHRYLYCFINDNFNIYDRLEEKDKEIERLNNIIDELEKDIKEDNQKAREYMKKVEQSGMCQGDYPVHYYYADKRIETGGLYQEESCCLGELF